MSKKETAIKSTLAVEKDFPGGPFRPKDIPFTDKEKIILPIPRNPT